MDLKPFRHDLYMDMVWWGVILPDLGHFCFELWGFFGWFNLDVVGEVFPLHILDLASQRGQGRPGEEVGGERFSSSCLLSCSYFSCLLSCLSLSNRDTAFILVWTLLHSFPVDANMMLDIFCRKMIHHIIYIIHTRVHALSMLTMSYFECTGMYLIVTNKQIERA